MTIPVNNDDDVFVASLLAEMRKAADGKLVVRKKDFAAVSKRFSIDSCTDKYLEVYGLVAKQEAIVAPAPAPARSRARARLAVM